jgi:hypothetical protein
MRGRLGRLGASGVQARTFHSAALRQLRWFWPTTYGGDLPTLTESKLPRRRAGCGSRPTRRCCATWPPRSSGRRSAMSVPTTTPGSPPTVAGRSRASTPRRSGACSAATRRPSAPRPGWTWRTSCC